MVTAASFPITCADTWVRTSHMTGLTLPGMIAEAGARAGAHPTDVVGDLGAAHRDRLERSAQLDQRVPGALGLEGVRGRRQPQAGRGGDPLADLGRELGVRVEPAAEGV